MPPPRIAVFFDSSGSLAEYGRTKLLQYLLSLTIDSFTCHTPVPECLFYIWAESITEIKPGFTFVPKGQNSLLELGQKILTLENQERVQAFLIITDDSHLNQASHKKEFSDMLTKGSAPIAAALIGSGNPLSLEIFTRHTTPFPADSLPLFLHTFFLQWIGAPNA